MNEPKEIHKIINGCNVTITFKGYNPDIKELILDMLCDSFEERVMNSSDEVKDNQISKSA